MMIYGAIYFLAPRITGRAWPSGALVRAHYAAALVGTVVLVVSLLGAGWVQGHDLNSPAISFPTIAGNLRSWLLAATAGQAVLLLGNLLLAVHLLWLICPKAAPATNLFRPAPTMEASVS
jgi:cytochrome c oxidase cbb3-type subunit 1